MRVVANPRPRPDAAERNRECGIVYDFTGDGEDPNAPGYMVEDTYVELTRDDLADLEKAARVVFEMLDEAGDWLAARPKMLEKMGIPKWAHEAVIKSWWRCAHPDQTGDARGDFGSVFGRFDFCYGGANHPNPAYRIPLLLEFNGDTPTTLPESAIAQWQWHEQCNVGDDQWNGIFEALVDAWKRNLDAIAKVLGHKPVIYVACSNDEPSGEDEMNTVLMQEAVVAAGYETERIYTEDIGFGSDGRAYDMRRHVLREAGIDLGEAEAPLEVDDSLLHHIEVVFKLYPWEYILNDKFGQDVIRSMEQVENANGEYAGGTFWIEPPYKMMWSNKAILAILWKLFGKDPERGKYLLPAYFADERHKMKSYVHKPMLGREGAGIKVIENGTIVLDTGDQYAGSGYIAQQLHWLPAFPVGPEERLVYFMTGVWMIDGEPAGVCYRGADRITNNGAQFYPHALNYRN